MAAEVAVSINGTCYVALQDAVNAVTDGRTITFIIDSNGKTFAPTAPQPVRK